MGEIADQIIDGTMCPCGEFVDGGATGPGFAQYCSLQCERDYGGDTHEFEGLEISNQRHLECDFFKPSDPPPSLPMDACHRKFKTPEAMEQHKRDKHGWTP